MTTHIRKGLTLGDAFREFLRHPTPWMLGATVVVAVAARIIAGDWQWTDALVPVVIVASFPFVEWLIHVCILHWRPRTVAGITIDPLLSRKHREHHVDPRNVPLIFIPWPVLLWLIPLLTLIAIFAFPRIGLGLTYLGTIAVIGCIYEWTHYLIHSDYQPKTRLYKAIRRNHRLHHFKNEHYWFSVTTSGTADRVLHTAPDPETVAKSPTAKNLHALQN
ncbi:sterol desaturase family protein [Antrihabitans cavernicola]|uniref:Sterol desaturase family protein n=1 Tax=Antrihabitans cavernicola TaxID=2495913 RepID=A0A5A7SGG4_9NOCA|nr:sterol desaturase family protein [Spelaeibacter cavernicola]KAA0024674.1 sterol desaturase family protein [Spelaeibacter cavernicola]